MSNIEKFGMSTGMDIPIEIFYRGADKLRAFDNVITDPRKKQHDHLHINPTANFYKYIDRNVIDASVRHTANRYIVNGVIFNLSAFLDIKKNNLYGGSIDAWSDFLCQLYILCKKDGSTSKLLNIIREAYQDCFGMPITNDAFMAKAGYTESQFTNDIVISDDLIAHDKIIDLIRKYKREIGNTNIEVNDILRIADRSIFSPIIMSASDDSKDQVYHEITKNKQELENILIKIRDSGANKPRIYQDIFDNDFHQILELSLTLLSPKPKNEYSVDEIFDACKELDSDRINKFVKNFIGDEDEGGVASAENTYKSILKEHLDAMAVKNDLITKKNDRYYSIGGIKDKVTASLRRLSVVLPTIEKIALAKEILKYIRG